MEYTMTVEDAIFSFRQEIKFALEDKDRGLDVIAQDIRDYADFLYEISNLDKKQVITVHEYPMGGFYYTKYEDEGEI